MTDQKHIHTEYLDYADDQVTCEGYVAYDDAADARRPCVMIAHAWDGQNDIIRAKAEQLAEMGYVGFALDVYGKGVRGDVMGDNSKLMAPFMEDRAALRRRLLAGLTAAKQHPRVDPDRIAVIGYCFGGLCALDLARSAATGLRGAVSFHGIFSPPNCGEQAPIKAKVLILHGWEDPMAPPSDVLAIARELTDAGADWQLHAYGHAMHAFTHAGANMPERGLMYNAPAEKRSWAAMVSFLREVFEG